MICACAALAGCSAHERVAAAAPQPASGQIAAVSLTAPEQVSKPTPAPSLAKPVQLASRAVAENAAPKPVPSSVKIGKSGSGLASWYGDGFHGNRTANGERFDMYGFTAAHRSMPLPSYVRVTNTSNGRSIVVRVNDRGPFHGNRVIDVSRSAADVLGFRGAGVGNVKLDYVGRAPGDRKDDRRLLASYQEFGRPSTPPGLQMAALTPLSDAELASGGAGDGGAFAVASRAVASSADLVMASASTVATKAKDAAATAKSAVGQLLPGGAPSPIARADTARADAAPGDPTVIAYAGPQPALSAAPAVITAPRTAGPRVIRPSEPALASVAPPLKSSASTSDVSSRIAAGFEGFDGFRGPGAAAATVGSVSLETTR